jgi:hypothetical protein
MEYRSSVGVPELRKEGEIVWIKFHLDEVQEFSRCT